MSKMSQLHAQIVEDNGGVDPNLPDDRDYNSPPTFSIHQRVKAWISPNGYCYGWVEVIEPNRIGVRLVNGNFRWCKTKDVTADNRGCPQLWGDESR